MFVEQLIANYQDLIPLLFFIALCWIFWIKVGCNTTVAYIRMQQYHRRDTHHSGHPAKRIRRETKRLQKISNQFFIAIVAIMLLIPMFSSYIIR